MLTRERPSAERTAKRLMTLQMRGGTLPRHTSVDIPIVSPLRALWSLRRLNSCTVAITALSHTVTFLTKAGRFRQAADREKEIAQIYIQEKQDLNKGCESYERAGDWYAQEDATAYVFIRVIPCCCSLGSTCRTANACFKDAADLHAELENYPAAIARYDQVANGSLASNLTKYSVKDYWLRAGLCALAMGVCSQHLALLRSLSLLDRTPLDAEGISPVTALKTLRSRRPANASSWVSSSTP